MMRSRPRIFIVVLFFLFFLCHYAHAALTLTGEVSLDFADVPNCFSDPDGKDMALPSGVTVSGMDIDRVCFFYDGATDQLHVGVEAVESAIFGDVDGDGNPAVSSKTGVTDFTDLGSTESFVISMDLDGDSAAGGFNIATVDILIGISNTGSLANLGVYEPSIGYDPDNPQDGFGTKFANVTTLFASPSAAIRDLEFMIDGFSTLTGELTDPAPPVPLQIFSHSVAGGVGADFAPFTGGSFEYPLYDFDRDQLMDWEELELGTDPTIADSDADGIIDGIEIAGNNPTDPVNADSDGDSLPDGQEDANQNGVVDEGETNPLVTDTDEDGLTDDLEINAANPTNPTVSDTDGDGILDGDEDANHNGVVDEGETDPNKSDTDGGGVNDRLEIENGFDPLDPDDDAQAGQVASQTGVPLTYDQLQGGGLSCVLLRHGSAPGSHSVSTILLLATILGLWRLRTGLRRHDDTTG